jgi:hypothetical protein
MALLTDGTTIDLRPTMAMAQRLLREQHMKPLITTWILALALVFAREAPAQSAVAPVSKNDWNAVQSLPIGARIRVTTTDRKIIQGAFQSAADEGLALGQSSGAEMLARSSIKSVSVKGPGHRMRHALIGLGIGAAGGLGLGAGVDASCNPHAFLGCIGGPNFGKEVLTPVGAVIGFGIGAVLPAGGWREVYRMR